VRGLYLFLQRDYEKAGEEFEAAFALDHEGTVGHGYYVHFLFMTGKDEEALRLLEECMSTQPGSQG
jgi:hypothetical protein